MNEVMLAVLAIIFGLLVLMKSADWLVDSANNLALGFGIQPLLVGVVVLGFGTSAPEIFVSITSAIEEVPNLAVGNVLGSNIANVAFVLSTAMLFSTLLIGRRVLVVELRLLLAITVLTGILLWDGVFSGWEAMILALSFLASLACVIHNSLSPSDQYSANEPQAKKPFDWKQCIWLIGSLILLPASANLLVWGASVIAIEFGVSELIIGLTVVAIGTSLPELAAVISAAIRQEKDLIMGNIIGSNLFNLGVVLPLSALGGGYLVDAQALSIDFPFMMGLTLFLLVPAMMSKTKKWQGAVLWLSFIGYLAMIYLRSTAA